MICLASTATGTTTTTTAANSIIVVKLMALPSGLAGYVSPIYIGYISDIFV